MLTCLRKVEERLPASLRH